MRRPTGSVSFQAGLLDLVLTDDTHTLHLRKPCKTQVSLHEELLSWEHGSPG